MRSKVLGSIVALALIYVIWPSVGKAQTPSDHFEDGWINFFWWDVGGGARGWQATDPIGTGPWSYSVTEIPTGDGYLRARVWGPATGNTYGAQAWIQTDYNYNDGQFHLIDFTWDAPVGDNHYNRYFVQVTNGYVPPVADFHWPERGVAGTSDLLLSTQAPLPGVSYPTGLPKSEWSMIIDPSGHAAMYDAPAATGSLLSRATLDSSDPWHLRFMVSDGTSAGFGAGAAQLDLYDFSPYELKEPQKVFLNLDAGQVPILVERKPEPFGTGSKYVETEGSMPSIHDALNLGEYRVKLEDAVRRVFADSGVGNVELVDSREGATTVWFSKLPDDPNWGLGGRAHLGPLTDRNPGIDRFNKNEDDSVILFVDATLPDSESDAELVSHELGHTFGLRHIDPKGPDGTEISSIMDYDSATGLEHFYNGVAEITEPPNDPAGGTGVSHNPTYHLKRFVEGLSYEQLTSAGVLPGDWDQTWWEETIKGIFDFADSDATLYDAYLFGGYGGLYDDSDEVLAHFDAISLSELSSYPFSLERGMGLEMYAASAFGREWDVALATGNPFEAGATVIHPYLGVMPVYLQMRSPQSPLGYITLAQGTLTGTPDVIPAPGAIVLGAIGASLVGYLRRRRVL